MRRRRLSVNHLKKNPDKLSLFKRVMIWSEQWKAWWRNDGKGYTDHMDQAWVTPIYEAWDNVKHVGPEKRIYIVEVFEDDDKVTMTVKFRTSPAQALALQAMFEYWNRMATIESSRVVGFFINGHDKLSPNCQISLSKEVPELTQELRRLLSNWKCVSEQNVHVIFNYKNIEQKIKDMICQKDETINENTEN